MHIHQCDVAYTYQRLCFALFKGIEHAAWSSSIWVLHLLWADVDPPPEGAFYVDVFVPYICDLAARARLHRARRSRIGLDVDGFERTVQVDVAEGDVPDT